MSDSSRAVVKLMQEGVFGTVPAVSMNGTTFSTDSTDNSLNDSGNGFITAGFVVGQRISTAGFTDPLNNGTARILTLTADKAILDDEINVATEVAGDTVTVKNSVLDIVRFTGESIREIASVETSKEIRSDRQIQDFIKTSRSVEGDLNFELSFEAYDDYLEALLHSSGFSAPVSINGTTFSMDAADNSLNDSAAGLISGGLVINQWVKTTGFTDPANNGIFKVLTLTAGKAVLGGGTVVTEADGDSVTTKMGPYITNGTTKRSFTGEREMEDLTNVFQTITGLRFNTMRLAVAAESFITGAFGFMGKQEASAAATVGTSEVNPPENEVMSASEDALRILENLVAFTLREINIDISNNLRKRSVIGSATPAAIGSGTINVAGSLKLDFANNTSLDKFTQFTPTSIAILLQDSLGNAYIIEMPNVRFSSNAHNPTAIDTDIDEETDFTAFRDATEGVTIRIAKFAA